MKTPSDLKWVEGPLPAVETVPYGSSYLVWLARIDDGRFIDVMGAMPHCDDLNPLRWCARSGGPLLGYLTDWEVTGHPVGYRIAWWALMATYDREKPESPDPEAKWGPECFGRDREAGLR